MFAICKSENHNKPMASSTSKKCEKLIMFDSTIKKNSGFRRQRKTLKVGITELPA